MTTTQAVYACPKCGKGDLRVEALATYKLESNGSCEPVAGNCTAGDLDDDAESLITYCVDCDYEAMLADFEVAPLQESYDHAREAFPC